MVHDPWRLDPLAWIHRSEARAIAQELRRRGSVVQRFAFRPSGIAALRGDRCILRLSDPVMLEAAQALSSAGVSYIGPGHEVMKRCYDKYAATRVVAAAGFTCPATSLGTDADGVAFPAVVKPRRGSDSIGVRHRAHAPLPARFRNERYVVQRRIHGAEITVGVLHGEAGVALHILVPDGRLYTFVRKYVLRPRIVPMPEPRLAARVRAEALRIAETLGVDWAARVDFIHDPRVDALYFLECDVAPLVGRGSAFDTSMRGAGLGRGELLDRLSQRAERARHRPMMPDEVLWAFDDRANDGGCHALGRVHRAGHGSDPVAVGIVREDGSRGFIHGYGGASGPREADSASRRQGPEHRPDPRRSRRSPRGGRPRWWAPETAAQTHAVLRARSGFDINQLVAEYRALRASVLRLWTDQSPLEKSGVDDMIRFNEAIDQAIAESVGFFHRAVERVSQPAARDARARHAKPAQLHSDSRHHTWRR